MQMQGLARGMGSGELALPALADACFISGKGSPGGEVTRTRPCI
jgi:hypothetical protein